MSRIIELMSQKKPFISSGGVTEKQINEAENILGVRFAKEYREYLAVFGTASYYGHELTGIRIGVPLLNVVDVTLEEKDYFTNIPDGWYVIEQTHMDGIVIWQDEDGKVYQAVPKHAVKICDSLSEYVSLE